MDSLINLKHLNNTALIINDNLITYGELNEYVNRLLPAFKAADLTDERVAFMLPNGLDIIVVYLSCFDVGATAVPLNRRYTAKELERTLSKAQAKWLIIEAEKLHLLDDIDIKQYGIKRVLVHGANHKDHESFTGLISEEGGAKKIEFNNTAQMILFTSGTTGAPKGIVHIKKTIQGIVDSSAEAFEIVDQSDIIQVAEPLCHISGFLETFSLLAHGGTVIVIDSFQEESYLKTLAKFKPTLICTHVDLILKLLDSGLCDHDTFNSLRGVYTGGDELPSIIQQRFMKLTGKPIQLGYGMTEAIWLTICRSGNHKGCIGKPVYDAELMIVDESGNEVKHGSVGEIVLKGSMVMADYWQGKEITKNAFVNGWFKTGDCGYLDDEGNYWFSGRIKNIIIRNTSNIMPGEIEEAISQHPDVAHVVVIGIPDQEEGEVPVAFVVKKSNVNPSEDEILDFLKAEIAEYKIPKYIYFIDTIPLTKTGKIDKQACKGLVLSQK